MTKPFGKTSRGLLMYFLKRRQLLKNTKNSGNKMTINSKMNMAIAMETKVSVNPILLKIIHGVLAVGKSELRQQFQN